MTPAQEIAEYLDTSSVGSFPADTGWSINVNRLPIDPATAIGVFDASGSEIILNDEKLRESNIKIIVRCPSYEDGWEKQEEIFEALNDLVNEQLTESFYLGARLKQDISSVGWDDQDRTILTSNFSLLRARA